MALEAPREAVHAFALWGARVADGDPALAPVPAEALHVTMAFLGECAPDVVGSLAEAVGGAAAPVPGLHAEGAVWLAPKRPHVLTAGLADEGGALGAVHGVLWGGLTALGFQPEARPFRPHLTVARVRRGQRPRSLSVPDPPAERFPALALTLMRSRLGGGQARYEPLERVLL